MSTTQAERCFEKAVEIADLFIENARYKHGLSGKPPKPIDEPVAVLPSPSKPLEPPSSGSSPAGAVAAGASPLLKAALAGALAIGTGGLGLGALSYFSKPATTIIEAKPEIQSVLPFLDEHSYNVPEKK